MESISFGIEKIDPVRVGVVLDRLKAVLAAQETGFSLDALARLAHPELTGLNEYSVTEATESKVATELNYWCDQLEQHLIDGSDLESFAAHNVWFVPLLQKAIAIQAGK